MFSYTGSTVERVLAASRINTVHWQGYDAEKRGVKLNDCPHAQGTGTRKAWRNGWLKSRGERQCKPR